MIKSPKSEKLARAILDWTQELAPHGILVTDQNLRIQSWNNWLEVHSGIKSTEAIGRTLFDLFPSIDSERLRPHFENALKGQVSVLSTSLHGYLLPLTTTVGSAPYPFMQQTARIGPLLSENDVCGTITTIEDVTNREWQAWLLQQQNERSFLLSWALGNLLKTRTPQDFLHELLPRVGQMVKAGFYTSYLLDEKGENFVRHVISEGAPAPVDVPESAPFVKKNGEGSLLASVETFVDRNFRVGSSVAVQNGLRGIMWEPLISGSRLFGFILFGSRERTQFESNQSELLRNVAQYVSVALDRTFALGELVKAQRALAEHAAGLERKVEERTANLVDTISDLEGFSYTVAHDLRAPIRHIKGYVDLLEPEKGERPKEELELLQRIRTSANSMETLTRDLLHYSGIARKDLRLQPVDVESLIDEIVRRDALLSEPGVVIVHRPLETVLGEPTLLQQCLLNLLENARKFVKAGVRPQIQVWKENPRAQSPLEFRPQRMVFNAPQHLPNGGNGEKHPHKRMTVTVPEMRSSTPRPFVRICISDNGIGIDKDFQQKIFGVFERACDAQVYEGTGIGLAIFAKAVSRMGGRYGVESAPGRGSQFWLELPRA